MAKEADCEKKKKRRRKDGRRWRRKEREVEKERWKKVEKEGEVDDEKQFRGEIRNLLLLPLSAVPPPAWRH